MIYILQNIYLSDYYFEVATLLRNSLLVSVITNNCEVLYNITTKQVKQIEALDSQLLYRVLGAQSKISYCLLLLDMGLLPLRYIIKYKRLLFLHYLTNKDDSCLAKRILKKQSEQPIQGDWIKMI